MRYASPMFEGKEQYVPIVMKNKDSLIGFIQGIQDYYDAVSPTLEEMELEELLFSPGLTVIYDLSSRKYNDIMPDGRRESLLTKSEMKKMITDLLEEIEAAQESNEDDTEYEDVLTISCPCGLGHYSWKKYEDIPRSNTKCDICGRYIIHYTEIDDWDIDYEEGKDI